LGYIRVGVCLAGQRIGNTGKAGGGSWFGWC
jgi:hypothetical protein